MDAVAHMPLASPVRGVWLRRVPTYLERRGRVLPRPVWLADICVMQAVCGQAFSRLRSACQIPRAQVIAQEVVTVAQVEVFVETVQLDRAGQRQIGAKARATALLKERHDDIEAAVAEASAVLRDSAARLEDGDGWRVTSVEAKFGLTLGAEAGVILSKASAEASFEVTITVERG